jgi:hypothetical protein
MFVNWSVKIHDQETHAQKNILLLLHMGAARLNKAAIVFRWTFVQRFVTSLRLKIFVALHLRDFCFLNILKKRNYLPSCLTCHIPWPICFLRKVTGMKSFQRTWKVDNEPWRLATCLDCCVSTLSQTKTFFLLLSNDNILISMSFSRWRGVSPLLPPSSPLGPSLQVPSICHHLRSVVSCLPSPDLVCELICEAECRPQGVWVKSSSRDLPHFDVYTKTW